MIGLLLAILVSSLQAEELTFGRALSEMVEQNVNVRVQQTKLSASETQVDAARGTFTPQLYLTAQQQNGTGTPLTGSSGYAAARVYSANATWNVFRSGSDAAGLRAAVVNRSYQT